jgi:hypothetical protein
MQLLLVVVIQGINNNIKRNNTRQYRFLSPAPQYKPVSIWSEDSWWPPKLRVRCEGLEKWPEKRTEFWNSKLTNFVLTCSAELNPVRSCSFVSDCWVGMVTSRIASLIYINLDKSEWFRVQSDVNEQGLRLRWFKPIQTGMRLDCSPIQAIFQAQEKIEILIFSAFG